METGDPLSFILLTLQTITTSAFSTSHVIIFLILIVLVIFSAFISGSEVAFFGLTTKEKEELKLGKHTSDKLVTKQLKNLNYLLATILTANNFVNVGIVLLASYLTNDLFDFSQNPTLGFVIQTVIITFILLLFGEILPKIYANNRSLPFSRLMAYPLYLLSRLFKPLTYFLVRSTNFVNRKLAKSHQNFSRDKLSTALELTSEELNEEKELLEGIIKFGNISVADIMISRVDITDIDIKMDFQTVIKTIVDSGYSRIPVYSEGPDKIKGVLYIKDLLPHLQKDAFKWQSLIRPPYFVPETKMINDLLEEFQTNKTHMAIIVDEYGGTVGIVTLEDILEEIVGEISDEFDVPERSHTQNPDGTFVFEGKTPLHDFCKITKLNEDLFDHVRGEADSLAGLLLEGHGEMPQRFDEITVLDYRFKVLSADDRRIIKVKYYPPVPEESEDK